MSLGNAREVLPFFHALILATSWVLYMPALKDYYLVILTETETRDAFFSYNLRIPVVYVLLSCDPSFIPNITCLYYGIRPLNLYTWQCIKATTPITKI